MCQDDLANQQDAADMAVQVDDLDRLEMSETDPISVGDASTPAYHVRFSRLLGRTARAHKADDAAMIDYMEQLEEAALAGFLEDPSTSWPSCVDPPITDRSEANRGGTASGDD